MWLISGDKTGHLITEVITGVRNIVFAEWQLKLSYRKINFLFLFYLLVDLGSNCVWVLSKFLITTIRQCWLQPVNLPQTIIYRPPHLRAALLSMFLIVNHTSKNANSQTRQVWNAFHLSKSHFAGQGSLWGSSLSIDILRLCGVYANTVFAELEPELHENW